jgi:hypothetical protein
MPFQEKFRAAGLAPVWNFSQSCAESGRYTPVVASASVSKIAAAAGDRPAGASASSSITSSPGRLNARSTPRKHFCACAGVVKPAIMTASPPA